MSIRRFVQITVAVLALGLVSSAGATPPGASGRIAYSSTQSGNSELYSVAPDGSSTSRLTWTLATEQSPAWSPDGTKIAYESASSGGRFRIWAMNADGSAQTQISPETAASADDKDPAWSPDGAMIAFGSTRGGTWNIWVMNADGTGLRQVTSVFSNDPSWSPDGRKLAYVGQNAIGVVDADGGNAHAISGPGNFPSGPSWSPDGNHIVFSRNGGSGYPGELYVAGADGSNEAQLTSGGSRNARPSWSPDGTRVVFQRFDGSWRLWTIGADGAGAQQLSFGQDDISPDWGTAQAVPVPSPPDAPIIEISSPVDGGRYFPGNTYVAVYGCVSFSSYIASCEGDVPPFTQLDFSTAGTHTFTVRAVDGQGRTATKTVTYDVLDLVPPQIDLRTPTDGAVYELGADVRADYACSDPGGSGIAQCQGNIPNGAPLDTDNAGDHVFAVYAFDNAGHLTQTRAVYTVVDRRPPRIEIGSPYPGLTYPLDTAATAYYYCWSPGGVRIASCSGTVPSGDRIPAATFGPHTFTVTARDENGKTTTSSIPYVVVYSFNGFDSPVDANGTINGAKAGDGIALKFSLGGDQGLNVISKSTWQSASCADWTPTGAATSADGKLSYSASTDRYKDIVSTSSSWKGTCRILRLDFADSITREVRVRFK